MYQKLLKNVAMAAFYTACPFAIMLGLYIMLMIGD
jgi:hypothetical protein